VDAILNVMLDVTAGMVVHEPVIARRVEQETPFMATEPILMAGVAAGGDRQELHEVIRRASMAVSAAMREEGTPNDLLQRLADAPAFAAVRDAIPGLADPRRFVGRAPEQVDEFLDGVIEPIRRRYADEIGMTSELRA
jgi:adenylosuccinate lyase